jgi:hypothetical protein
MRLSFVRIRNDAAQPVQDVVGLCAEVRVASFGYNAAAPGTKFAVASPNFAAGAYLRHIRRCSLCFEEKYAASSS